MKRATPWVRHNARVSASSLHPSQLQPEHAPVVAVLIPCHNEEQTVGTVVRGFRRALPEAMIVVADNNSTDGTAAAAAAAGARVLFEPRPGKGMAVRRLFADVEADCYVMVDGDATYDPSAAPELVERVIDNNVDMVNGARQTPDGDAGAYRPGHTLGNNVLTWIFQRLFGLPIDDTLSGYRALSRRFVKSFPSGATGFEIEAELNAHAAVLGVPTDEIQTRYLARPEGSESKLNTYGDGIRILRRNLRLFRDARPNTAFSLLALPWAILAVLLIVPPVVEYFETGLVSRYPSLIAGIGAMLVAVLLVIAGIIMERVARNRVEAVRLQYLAFPSPAAQWSRPPTRNLETSLLAATSRDGHDSP